VNVELLAIEGVVRATPRRKGARQFDWFRADALSSALPADWHPGVATSHRTVAGHVAGLFCEDDYRVVTCPSGRVALVVVDVRRGSHRFGRWIPEDLGGAERVTIVIPPHVAWGFQCITDDAVLLSLHREPGTEVVIDPFDEELQIAWPLDGHEATSAGASLAKALPFLPWQGLQARG
jgi:dTDP-4-dehydrorhamnose 3,5-epimerase